MGKTPFLSGSPSMCPIWKQKVTYVREKTGTRCSVLAFTQTVPGEEALRTHPPLLVLFSCHYDHLSFHKGQLVVVVGLAVVDGLHASGFGLTLDRQKSSKNVALI